QVGRHRLHRMQAARHRRRAEGAGTDARARAEIRGRSGAGAGHRRRRPRQGARAGAGDDARSARRDGIELPLMIDLGKKPDPHEATGKPSPWVARFVSLIPEGETLDVACGGGRHSRLLAAAGYAVLAVDRKADMLAQLAAEGIRTLEVDLETGNPAQSWPF